MRYTRVLISPRIGQEPACQCTRGKKCRLDPWIEKIPWGKTWQPTPVFLLRESHGQRCLLGYSPLGCKELDTTWVTQHVACTHYSHRLLLQFKKFLPVSEVKNISCIAWLCILFKNEIKNFFPCLREFAFCFSKTSMWLAYFSTGLISLCILFWE